eukprot:TRINITY_DN8533_c0_g1_i12.p1 TRINITY_DN8533_c0_g1~~TRINITY_DN8533_c0_g1_i12.p1  ORF type:complete len:361 (-),score=121.08 TRINITY_DN8533_c0_g1_i12:373-1455(-)
MCIRDSNYFELSETVAEMGFYCVERKTCRELVTEYAQTYDVSEERVLQLLIDYESVQQFPRVQISACKYLRRAAKKRQAKHGGLKTCVALAVSLGLVGQSREFSAILLVSKDWNKAFKRKICKQVLKTKGEKHRLDIWKSLSGYKITAEEYHERKERIMREEKEEHLSEIIRVDVIRSFHDYPIEYRSAIINILRVYADYNEEVKYCQGMNCIAGFLYTVYKDEFIAFHILAEFISKYNLSPLFKEGVPLLKSYFYQLNRLMAIYLPRVHAHLSEEKVSVGYFSPAWFLTIFTCVIQYTEDMKVPPLLLKVFDNFLVSGTRTLFKTALFILDHFEKKLLSLNCEDLMQFFTEEEENQFLF